MYITGGCGALYDGASPDGSKDQKSITRVHQAYDRNYQLPNLTAHSETCANIGNVLWNWRMFLATGQARFIDTLELALYNSVLSGVSLDGTNFFTRIPCVFSTRRRSNFAGNPNACLTSPHSVALPISPAPLPKAAATPGPNLRMVSGLISTAATNSKPGFQTARPCNSLKKRITHGTVVSKS